MEIGYHAFSIESLIGDSLLPRGWKVVKAQVVIYLKEVIKHIFITIAARDLGQKSNP